MRVIFSDPNVERIGNRLWADSRYRPFLGISVSSRPLPLDIAAQILRWCLQAENRVLPIMIADELAHINYMALSHYGPEGALGRARRDGDRHIEHWQQVVAQLDEEQAERIRFVRWPELWNPRYRQQVEVVREEFQRGGALRSIVDDLVNTFAAHLGKRLTPDRSLTLAEFVIQEIPSLLFGIQVDGIQYQMSVYPTAKGTLLMPFIVAIQQEPQFAGLRQQLQSDDLEYNTMAEILLAENGDLITSPPSAMPHTLLDNADAAANFAAG